MSASSAEAHWQLFWWSLLPFETLNILRLQPKPTEAPRAQRTARKRLPKVNNTCAANTGTLQVEQNTNELKKHLNSQLFKAQSWSFLHLLVCPMQWIEPSGPPYVLLLGSTCRLNASLRQTEELFDLRSFISGSFLSAENQTVGFYFLTNEAESRRFRQMFPPETKMFEL